MEEKSYPVQVSAEYTETPSRLWALLTLLFIPKLVLLIPHFIALWALSIVALIIAMVSQIIVLFTAKYPKELFDFVVSVARWRERVAAYMMGLTHIYPPFTFKP